MSKEKPEKQKSGPKSDRIKIEGKWEDAMAMALEKERPKGGWPKKDGNTG